MLFRRLGFLCAGNDVRLDWEPPSQLDGKTVTPIAIFQVLLCLDVMDGCTRYSLSLGAPREEGTRIRGHLEVPRR